MRTTSATVSAVTGSREDRPDYDYTHHPTIDVFGMAPGATRRVAIHGDNGREAAVLEVHRGDGSLEATLVGGLSTKGGSCSGWLHRADHIEVPAQWLPSRARTIRLSL